MIYGNYKNEKTEKLHMKKENLLYFIILDIIFFLVSIKISILVYIPIFLIAIFIAHKAIIELYRYRVGTELFLLIATIIGVIGNEEQAVGLILIIMLIAYYIEELILDKTDNSIENIINLVPNTAILKDNLLEKVVNIDQLKPGQIIIVKTGAIIPVDGLVKEGTALINSSALTGENKLENKKIGDQVFAGTFIESGSLIIKIITVGPNTFFGKIKSLIEEAENNKPEIMVLSDKIANYLVPILLLFITITWFITQNIKLTITLLVFGSPLELVLIIPLAILSSIIAGFKNGIIIKSGRSLEILSQSNIFIFDKTGTLTEGRPKVVEIETYMSKYEKLDILKIAAIAEKRSLHPISKAVLEKAIQENILVPDPEEYINVNNGIIIKYDNITYKVGNFNKQNTNNANSNTNFYIETNNKIIGKISLEDQIRDSAKIAINKLKTLKIKTYLLTGDSNQSAIKVAGELGIDNVYSNLFPNQKLEIIKTLQNSKNIITMIGDGINDAPALKQANIGIAMGNMGMEPAIKAADIILLTNSLEKIIFVYNLSKKTILLIKQTIFIGFLFTHITGMLLAFLNLISPIQAAFIHAILDIIFLLNIARLIYFKDK